MDAAPWRAHTVLRTAPDNMAACGGVAPIDPPASPLATSSLLTSSAEAVAGDGPMARAANGAQRQTMEARAADRWLVKAREGRRAAVGLNDNMVASLDEGQDEAIFVQGGAG
ncbi:MAG TPA: hypothetical protein VLA16_00955 [Ideonella sp.]|nr:hypothetical protein [Ideonella sp.]